jgi:TPP-dependent pyruvate/acetoin dehydrogenase alpha subunit
MTVTRPAGAPETAAPDDSDLSVPALLGLLEQMALIRQTEKAAYDLFMSGLVKGTTHLAAGHEAVAVGASAALNPDDVPRSSPCDRSWSHARGDDRGADEQGDGLVRRQGRLDAPHRG